MSKVICDVCGTSFPETAERCPICGCVKAADAQVIASDDFQGSKDVATGSGYVRGGRFSKGNVRRSAPARAPQNRPNADRSRKNEPQGGNKGLIAVVVILLVAIVMVVAYIGIRVLNGFGVDNNSNQNKPSENIGDQTVLCTKITLNSKFVELREANSQYLLAVMTEPENTTEQVIFESSDPTVVTVDQNGLLVPVGYGTATIYVRCGTIVEECTVSSNVGTPPSTAPSTKPGPTLPVGFQLKLSTYKDSGEITIAGDATAILYKETMGVKASDILWTTSDPAIATVEDGKVTGVGKGYCYITATIGDQTATCKVICTSNAAPPSDYKISHVDVTISVGETFNLSLRSKETGANVQGIEWQASQEGIVSIAGNKITGQAVCWAGINVFVEYEGVTYSCRIIVKPAA